MFLFLSQISILFHLLSFENGRTFIIGQERKQDKKKPKRGSSRPVSVRMATDALTMASRKTSCSDTVGNMAAVAPAKKCVDGQQVFDDF